MPADSFKSVKDLLNEKVKGEGTGDDAEASAEQPDSGVSKREKQFNQAFRGASGPLAKTNWRAGG